MVFWLCCLIGILAFIILILIIKICLLNRSADEIADGFADRVASDTNTLIDLSSRDRHMRREGLPTALTGSSSFFRRTAVVVSRATRT